MDFKINQFKSKKAFVIALVIVAVGAFFLWKNYKENQEGVLLKFEPPENYVIKDTPEGKIVENKKADSHNIRFLFLL